MDMKKQSLGAHRVNCGRSDEWKFHDAFRGSTGMAAQIMSGVLL